MSEEIKQEIIDELKVEIIKSEFLVKVVKTMFETDKRQVIGLLLESLEITADELVELIIDNR